MKKNTSYKLVGLTLSIALLLISSCGGNNKKSNRKDTPTSGTISFVSDESFSPIIEEERKQFEFEYPNAHLKPIYTDEVTGLQMIKDLKTCLLITSRGLTPREIAYIKTKNINPSVFPIGYDGVSLIVNSANNDTCISVKDIKGILTGKVTDWGQLVPGSKRGKIEVIVDNERSATTNWIVDSLLKGKTITNPNIYTAKKSKEVVDYVDKTPNSIGIIGSNWLNDRRDTTNTTFKKNVHVMSISVADKATPMNSWKPYQAYLLDGRYPLVRTLWAIVADPFRALPWSFANYITNPKGQLIIFKSGLLPYRGDITIRTVDVKR